jgi:acetyltransferase
VNADLLPSVRPKLTSPPSFSTEPINFNPEETVFLKEYGRIKLRPIVPEDVERMIRFHATLSEESVYFRYFEPISLETRALRDRLARVCANTADTFAMVAERVAASHHPSEIMGVGRLNTTEIPEVAAFATLISDEARRTKVPTSVLERLITIAGAYGFKELRGEMMEADIDALKLCRSLGFELSMPEKGIVKVSCACKKATREAEGSQRSALGAETFLEFGRTGGI